MPRNHAEWVLRFKQEASQHLAALERGLELSQVLAGLAGGPTLNQVEKDNLHELYRLAHTIKGSAAMVGEAQTSQLARQLEQIFSLQFETELRLTPAQYDAALALIGQIQSNLV